jgi:hypothetical protein
VTLASCENTSSDNTGVDSRSTAAPAASAEPAPAKFAACTFITMKDAEALFGQPATQQQGPTTPLHGECDWHYEAPDNSSHLLQLIIKKVSAAL